MESADMVHALEKIQRLLKPDGCLIDVHPVLEDPLIETYQGGRVLFTESVPVSAHNYKVISQADDALAQVVQRGLFIIERRGEFDLTTYASSAIELQEFFAKASAYHDIPKEDAVEAQRTALYARVEEIMQAAGGGAEIAYHERARITRMNPNVRKEEPI